VILSRRAFARQRSLTMAPKTSRSSWSPLLSSRPLVRTVVDYKGDPVSVESGIGNGFTTASDASALKLILSRDF
jgi:hypothetical protein